MSRVLADNPEDTLALDNLALIAAFLDRCFHLHENHLALNVLSLLENRGSSAAGLAEIHFNAKPEISVSLMSVGDTSLRKVIYRNINCHSVTRKDLDEVHPHLTGDMRQNLMVILQLHLEHCVGQRLNNNTFSGYCIVFCHAFSPSIKVKISGYPSRMTHVFS